MWCGESFWNTKSNMILNSILSTCFVCWRDDWMILEMKVVSPNSFFGVIIVQINRAEYHCVQFLHIDFPPTWASSWYKYGVSMSF